ncbi:NAD(P)H-dependent glycerol-3-phosphate dehydrogenase [Rubeoparvulum massiliense]|uniref:NAD(P)H-dependent glycerol-3-phosphate dehydrogenase n=1 Tax=Rubeoparvulum massiliense TaxID=1631346 RepID=UPI00065E64B2|nr:NAD(P)H-dependent glycerol-3-phosphate dehydrogenase [Rubeoparvulum massiliense]
MITRTAVIGAGSWGTALSMVLTDNGYPVSLWTRSEDQVAEINSMHTNRHYLPEATLSSQIVATSNLENAVVNAQLIVIAVPSHAMREVVVQLRPYLKQEQIVVHVTKGLETSTLQRMSEVIRAELPTSLHDRIAVLSGPSHAEEVSRRDPTTVVVASEDLALAEQVQDIFSNDTYFRVYTNHDVIGVELGGALKNIIALGAGLNDGLNFGDNARAALMTRGLAEISRVGIAMGAQPLTFAGLAGVGDLIVTCTSKHSRNWRAGHMLAEGYNLEQVLEQMGMVVEGIKTTKAAYALSQQLQIEMPITKELYLVLFEGKAPRQAVLDLMGRVRRNEREELNIRLDLKKS